MNLNYINTHDTNILVNNNSTNQNTLDEELENEEIRK